MKNWKRFICWALLLVLLFTHLGGGQYAKAETAGENEEAAEQINYVLVLDCTRKAAEADDEYNIRKAAGTQRGLRGGSQRCCFLRFPVRMRPLMRKAMNKIPSTRHTKA